MGLRVENFKTLSYVVRNRRGYQHNLYQYNDASSVEELKIVGFINTGHTLKHETFSTTKSADNYYKEMFGRTAYYKERFKGFINKLCKNNK